MWPYSASPSLLTRHVGGSTKVQMRSGKPGGGGRVPGLLVAMLVGCLLLAVPMAASERWGEICQPAGGRVLRAGEWAEVAWTALPPEVEEFELLLSLDDGASFAIRLTPQLDPGIGGYRWLVPNFPSRRARMRLRVGIDHHEIERPAGEPFEIVGEITRPLAGLRWVDGEWWSTTITYPTPPLERLPVRVDVPDSPSEVVVAALSTREMNAVLEAACQTFERSSPQRRPVRAPPVTDHSPLATPQRE